MATEPRAMREIHEIREKLYEEMKGLTPEEYATRVNREAEELARKHGLKIQTSAVAPAK